jgi:hypothetical protein
MATETEQQELMETLKFIPCNYKLEIYGYGGEIVMGKISQQAYEYWTDNEDDLSEFACAWDESDFEIPEEAKIFTAGEWHDCDDILHENGVEMSGLCSVTVYDENDNEVWTHNLEPSDLDEDGIDAEETEETYVDNLANGTCIFIGQSTEKGCFADVEIALTQPFDPSKLKFNYHDVDGWCICTSIEYNGADLENDGYSTTGKGIDFYIRRSENNG